MPSTPFETQDFAQTAKISGDLIPEPLATKINEFRHGLGSFPEFELDFFRKRVRRHPEMRGKDGLVFGRPRAIYDGHWFLFTVGGDQDEVQLGVGMWSDKIRVGMGFQIGRQVEPKMPVFRVLQSFLGMRPPLPFRDALYRSIKRNKFLLIEYSEEEQHVMDADEILRRLETLVVSGETYVFLGSLWDAETASSKTLDDYRLIFREFMPFYEELLLAGGRYEFYV